MRTVDYENNRLLGELLFVSFCRQTQMSSLGLRLSQYTLSQRTIYGCSNVSTRLGESCENAGTLSCCNIFQDCFKNVATTLPHDVGRKYLHTIMATLIHLDNVEVLEFYDIHNVVATFLQYGKISVDHIMTCLRQKLTEWPFHWLILCSTFAKQMPLTKCDDWINK